MVGGVVYGVHTNSVDAQLLELFDIALAAVDIGNGVLGIRGAAGLVVDTANIEAAVAGPEGCSGLLAGVRFLDCQQSKRTIALDGDLGHAAGAGASGSGLDLSRGGGGGGESGRSGGDSNSALHRGGLERWCV